MLLLNFEKLDKIYFTTLIKGAEGNLTIIETDAAIFHPQFVIQETTNEEIQKCGKVVSKISNIFLG